MYQDRKFKFQYYLNRVEGQRVLWMPRDQWVTIKPLAEKPVKVDISETPMSNVARDASVLISVTARSSDQTAKIDIYRYDEKDQPTPVNKDTYIVMENILGRPDYQELIIKSSTSDSTELREFLGSHIALVKADNNSDHWLTELPSSVLCILDSKVSHEG